MDRQKQQWVWGIWIVLWLPMIVVTYILAPPHIHGSLLSVVVMGILIIITLLSSFKVKEANIMVNNGISLATFLIFGLFIELILTQIAIFISMLPRRLGKEDWYRYAINLTMFGLMSVSGGIAFYALNGVTGIESTERTLQLIPFLSYILIVFFLNHILMYIVNRTLFGNNEMFGRDVLWETVTTAIMMPVGIIFYLLFAQMGPISITIVAVPIVTFSVIFRLVNNSYEINKLLQKTNEVGSQLTEKLDVKHIVDLFFEKIGTIMDVDYIFILEEGKKDPRYYKIKFDFKMDTATSEHRAKGKVVRWPRELLGRNYRANTRKEWRRLLKGFLPVTAQSVLMVPTRRENHAFGAVAIATQKRRAYGKQHLMVLEILSNFLTVAIDNANDYEMTKRESERDPLTNLYNYRYFTKLLETQYTTYNGNSFSIVMIDLDHFKQINDTYGHENGNVILKGVADRLTSIVGNKGTVARYGGEEFILLLPDTENPVCYELAEEIRQRLSGDPFLVTISSDNRRLVHVTASIGIATAPSQGDDSLSLIRNADRAMYAGAKRRGRNRVATYIG